MPRESAVSRTVETVWKMESARLVAGLFSIVRDIGIAEEIAQDACVAALRQWPDSGIPENPGAWLMAVAKRRAIDRVRRERLGAELPRRADNSEHATGDPAMNPDLVNRLDGGVEDDLLRLIFTACHPSLSPESRAAITLRLLCGLTTDEIARAFLVAEPTIAQRLVRAKRTLAARQEEFAPPVGAELVTRLESVLEVIYLLFNEGYTAAAGDDWMRPSLCEEALRLGRVLAELLPQEPEVHGLVGLMEIQSSRVTARIDGSGAPVLLLDQDRALWDQLLIRRGLAALERAVTLRETPGPYVLQASIAACHARARTADQTDWERIAGLYGQLAQAAPSPIVELNMAVAVAMAFGPARGLEIVDRIASEAALAGYHLLPSVRGDLLFRLGRFDEAAEEFERAARLTRNERERALLLARRGACGSTER